MPPLREVLYISLLATDQSTTVVGQIVTVSRARNLRDGITGLLIFDGMRFCHHFEGPADAVQALLARLEADRRHVELRVLYDGELTQRRYQRFEMGLAEVDDHEDLVDVNALHGSAALEYFIALRSRFDISS
ncbi:BLUF domain-containing protein [Variovorax sp. YR216]|uniref:BLUF domain-containing protein n=1 Tax=Variovorax sp. YR216 TaxID=1882828 RepID=UPI0008960ED7|nr:BLUF domain-containing protein [Variovorax sp. YR216]SEA98630.1 Sensors of blue-light using FAD [Variovorax sp. YR216]